VTITGPKSRVALLTTSALILTSLVLISPAVSPAQGATPAAPTLLSQNAAGVQGDNSSIPVAATPDFGTVVIQSQADNLVPAAQDAPYGVHLYFAGSATAGLTQVDVNAAGVGLPAGSRSGGLSPDGRFFEYTQNLAGGGSTDYLVDRESGAVRTNPCGLTSCGPVAFTSDDAYMAFAAYNYGGLPVPTGERHVFVLNLVSAAITVMDPGTPCPYFADFDPQISSDGWVYWDGCNTALDAANNDELFRAPVEGGQIQIVDTTSAGALPDGQVNDYNLSPDGRFIAFNSLATNLVPGDADGQWRPYLKDLQSGTVTALARSGSGPNYVTSVGNFQIELGAFTTDDSLVICTQDPNFVPQGVGAVLRKPDGSLHWFSAMCPRGISADGTKAIYATDPTANDTSFTGSQVVIDSVQLADEQPPSVSIAGIANGATYEFGAVPTATCVAIDATDGTVSVPVMLSTPFGPRSSSGLGQVTASCTYTNSSSLTGSASATYNIADTTGPAISVPSNISIEATGPSTPITYAASAVDLVDGVTPVICDHPSGTGFGLGATTVTCSSSDSSGNSSSAAFVATVVDTTPPTITTPGNLTAPATGPSGAVVNFSPPTARDMVDGSVPVTCSASSSSAFPLGTTTVHCSASDNSGNTAQASFTVSVEDTTAPVVTTSTNITASATGPSGSSVAFPPSTALDVVDGAIGASCDHMSGATFPLGSTTVTCTAMDSAGNKGTASFTITVLDTTPPILTIPPHVTAEATGPLGTRVPFAAPTALDAVDGSITPQCNASSGSAFGLGDTIVTCTATDSSGNQSQATFTVSVVDTTPPTITTSSNLTVEAAGPAGVAVNYPAATALDTVDGPVAASCTPASGGTFTLGTTLVTCSATDAHGNRAAATFTIKVQDTIGPSITVPANVTVQATSAQGAMVHYPAVTAVDLVDGTRPVNCTPASGALFAVGTTTVSCTSSDRSGNSSAASFTVTVVSGAPTITVPATVVTEATSSAGAIVSYPRVTAKDVSGASVPVTCSPPSGARFAIGNTTVTCTAIGLNHISGSATFIVRVQDTTAPTIMVQPNLTVVATSSEGRTVTFSTPLAIDAVDGLVPVTCNPASGSLFPLGTTTVTCTATDKAGNTSHTSFTLAVAYSWVRCADGLSNGGHYRLGQKIQILFRMTGDSAPTTDANAHVWVAQLSGQNQITSNAANQLTSTTSGNTFGYQGSSQTYAFNLDTTLLTPGTWQVTLDTGDGNTQTSDITITQ